MEDRGGIDDAVEKLRLPDAAMLTMTALNDSKEPSRGLEGRAASRSPERCRIAFEAAQASSLRLAEVVLALSY